MDKNIPWGTAVAVYVGRGTMYTKSFKASLKLFRNIITYKTCIWRPASIVVLFVEPCADNAGFEPIHKYKLPQSQFF